MTGKIAENTEAPGPPEIITGRPGVIPDTTPEITVESLMVPKITPRKPRKNIDDPCIELGEIQNLQILNEHGELIEPSLEPDISDAELKKIYRAMVVTRALDQRMLMMQRQGQMGTFAPGLGQEATQIGQIYPLTKDDWFSPSYRSFGAQMWRGWSIDQLMLLWDGYFEGFGPPEGVNDLPFSIVIGSHVPTATGIAMGMRVKKKNDCVMVNFGDGASSQGIVSESFNFAGVYRAPVVFVLENNGWAISMPANQQTITDYYAIRGIGFGLPSIRVDGNDILAMIVASTQACEHARSGKGPYLIEAVTYRMSLHTTADDPKVYRTEKEVDTYKDRCPIRRFEIYLKNKGVMTDADFKQTLEECEKEILEARERFRKRAKPNAREVFDYMFEEMPPELKEQQAEYFAKLDRQGVE